MNKIKDTVVNLDLFSSFKEQELPGPRVKGGAVYNYHYCNRYENSRTAKHIGGSTDKNGNTCNTNQRDDFADADNVRINANIEYEINSLKPIVFSSALNKGVTKSLATLPFTFPSETLG